MSGTVIDKATALKHSVAGSNINKVVCKAASHELAGPKKKHVDCKLFMYIIHSVVFVSCILKVKWIYIYN